MSDRQRTLVCRSGDCPRTAQFDTLRDAYGSDWSDVCDYGVRVDRQTIEHQATCPEHTESGTDDDDDDTVDDDVRDSASSTDTKSAVYGPYHERKNEIFNGNGTTRLSMSLNKTQVNDGGEEREKTVIEVLEDYRDNE